MLLLTSVKFKKICVLGKERKKKKRKEKDLIRELQNYWISANDLLLYKVEMIGHNWVRLWKIVYRKVKNSR